MAKLKAKDSRLLDFPVDYVYRTITDFTAYSKWWPHEIKFDIEHLHPAVVGTTINIQNGPFVKWKSKITSFKTNKLLAIDYVEGAWVGKTLWSFEEKDGATELTFELDIEVNKLWLNLLSPFINFSGYHSHQVKHIFNNLEKYLRKHKDSYIHRLQLSHLDHIVLTVKDIDASCRFYHNVLGMEIITFGEGRKAVKFGSQKINFHDAGNSFFPKAEKPLPGSTDLCFISHTSINQVVLELKSKNIDIIEGPIEKIGANGKMISVYFHDPDGNLIEISNYVK